MKQKKTYHIIFALLSTVMILAGGLFPLKAEAEELQHLVDNADLIEAEEESRIEAELQKLSTEHQLDVVVFTEENEDISSAMDAADDFFDYQGYGKGSDRSGVLLYINMETRDVWISTRGEGITVFNDIGIDHMLDEITPSLSDGEYVRACDIYLELCQDFIIRAENGEPYGTGKGPFPLARNFLISIVVALIVGGFYIFMLSREMNSVAPNNSARNYAVPGSMQLHNSNEFFLYRNVTKTKRETSSGSGGSSTHRSSSGARHGGGGRKF